MAQMIFHYRPAGNFLVRMNPMAKLVAMLSYSMIISGSETYAAFALSALPLILAIIIRLPLREYLKEGAFFIVIAFLMGVSSYASYGSLPSAMASAISFLAIVLSSMLLADTVMPADLARSVGSALSHVIGRWAYSFAALAEMTLSMIPLVAESVLGIHEAFMARGASFSAHPLRFLTGISVSIFTEVLIKAESYIDALMSRGYDPAATRESLPYKASDAAVIAFSIVMLILHIAKEYI